MKFRAAILEQLNAPMVLDQVENEPLGIGQVLVQILVSGICGAQLQEIRGEKMPEHLPRLLGHEAAGRVKEIGPGVTTVKPGDKVVCHWRRGEGIESEFPAYLRNGQRFTSGRITTFGEFSVCSENRVTRVPDETPNELCALLGCGLSTALGVMENEARLRMGESVLIVGCGGVGVNLIRAARVMSAGTIAVLDIHADKRKLAMESGAHWFFESIEEIDARFDLIVDTSGHPITIGDTLLKLAPSGRYILIGQPGPKQAIMLHEANHLFDGTGKTIRATQGGCFTPNLDIPRYVSAWRAGHLSLSGIVSHRLRLDDINDGIELVKSGQAGRVMVEML